MGGTVLDNYSRRLVFVGGGGGGQEGGRGEGTFVGTAGPALDVLT